MKFLILNNPEYIGQVSQITGTLTEKKMEQEPSFDMLKRVDWI